MGSGFNKLVKQIRAIYVQMFIQTNYLFPRIYVTIYNFAIYTQVLAQLHLVSP